METTQNHVIDQMACFTQALAMVANRNRASGYHYRNVLYPLVDSHNKALKAHLTGKKRANAGGPAMRMARALWAFSYRTMYPEDIFLVMAEENATGHFYHFHRKIPQGHYHISNAGNAFLTLRQHSLGLPAMPKNIEPDADTPNPVRDALLELDTAVYDPGVAWYVKQNDALQAMVQAVNRANPEPPQLVIATAQALRDYALHLTNGNDLNAYIRARNHHDPLAALQYKHRLYLQAKATELNDAINKLRYAIRPITQKVPAA